MIIAAEIFTQSLPVMSTGLFVRALSANNTRSMELFIAQSLMTVLSPAAFLAFNYIVYGRLVRLSIGLKYSMVNAAKVARFFVISDIATFLIQVRGLVHFNELQTDIYPHFCLVWWRCSGSFCQLD